MNCNYFCTVAPKDAREMESHVVSEKFMDISTCKAFQNILTELYYGDLKDIALETIIRMACREFNIRFEGYNIKPYVIPVDDIIYF